jgi:hypothetical protein
MRLRCGSTAKLDAGIEPTHHHHRGRGFPAPGLADQADALTFSNRERDSIHRAKDRFRGRGLSEQFAHRLGGALARIFLHKISHFEQRLLGFVDRHFRHGCRRRQLGTILQQAAQRAADLRRRLHQALGIGVRRRLEYFRRQRGLDDLPLLHHDHAVAISGGKTEIVRDQDRRHAARTRKLDHEVHHGFLRRHIETRGGLVRNQEPRLAGKCQRNHDALAHAAGKLERIGVIALFRPRDLHLAQHLDRFFLDIAHVGLYVLLQHVFDLAADLADRIQRRARILEDHRHFAAAQVAHHVFFRILHIDAGEYDRPVRNRSGAVENAHDGIGGNRFSGAGFADDTERLALCERDIDLLDRANDAAAGRKLDGNVLDFEKRCVAHVPAPYVLRCGSTMSRRPSPKRLKQNTASISASPGNSAIHHSPETI